MKNYPGLRMDEKGSLTITGAELFNSKVKTVVADCVVSKSGVKVVVAADAVVTVGSRLLL